MTVSRLKKIRVRPKRIKKPRRPKPATTPHTRTTSKRGQSKGKFTPKHPEKYVGDLNDIIFRSSWELSFMNFLDNNIKVEQWGSEIIPIPYLKPTTGRVHKYYPDFWVKYKNSKGETYQEVIEVKPGKQARPPTTVGKTKKTQLYEALQWSINSAKWRYAKLYCDKYSMKFRILTEREIFK